MTLASIANNLSSPLVHGLLVFAVLKLIGHFSKTPKYYNYLSFVPLLWLLFCSMPYTSVLLIKSLEDKYQVIPIQSDTWKNTDAIVVLACNHYEDDKLPIVSRWPNCSLQRNLHAVLMYKAHSLPIYLAGGVLGKNDHISQARHNQSFLESMGVDSADIFITENGFNTETEVKALISIIRGKRISLVTSSSHLPRAVKYFEEQNIDVLPIPVEHLSRKLIEPVIGLPNASSLYRSERAIHEYLGLFYQAYLR